MRRALVAALAAAALTVSACDSHDVVPSPGPARIDVDTPKLQQMKRAAGIEPCRPGHAAAVDGGLPDITLPCFGGGPSVRLSSLRGPLVVNLFASWCGPCREEMPVLQQFHEKYGDRVPVIGIDFQDPQTEGAMELARRSGVTYPLLADPQSRLQGAAPFPARMGLPLFAFVAKDGKVSLSAGGVTSLGEMVQLVNQQLGLHL